MNYIKLFEDFTSGTVYQNTSGQSFWGDCGAGVLPICSETKRILVPYRSLYVNEPHTWGIWGGKLDEEDITIFDVAEREFIEETHYNGDITLYPGYVFRAKGFEYHNFIGLLDNEFIPYLNWETESYKWITFEELLKLEPKHFGLKALLNDSKSMEMIKKYSL